MQEAIAHAVGNAPECSGVYKMYDINQNIIYIGKAKNIKKRLQSYTKHDASKKTSVMLQFVKSVVFEVTQTEDQALILEASLIKKHQPKYNILLKDDKSRIYIKISNHSIPSISRYRGRFNRNSTLFGPFGYTQGSPLTTNETIKIIMEFISKVFKIRSCKDTKFKIHQAMNKPCLEYQIGTCSGPCANKITKEEYQNSVTKACKFLNGNYAKIRKSIMKHINELAQANNFLEAGFLKKQLTAINYLKNQSNEINFDTHQNLDVIALNTQQTAVEVFAIRNGYALGGNLFEINTQEKTKEEILEAFLYEYYSSNNPPPEKIFVNQSLNKENIRLVFKELFCTILNINKPRTIKDKKLMQFVEKNLSFQTKETQKKKDVLLEGIGLLANELQLPPLKRVEVYDNSHTSGAFFMGAFIVASPNGFEPSQYRKFNAKFSKSGDDYAMMHEIILRRFQGALSSLPKPDLLIIDGGIGQFNTVIKTLNTIDLDIPVVAIAKGEARNAGNETFFTKQNPRGFKIINKRALYFAQNLRDEAHRFVITTQRNKRDSANFNTTVTKK